MNELVTNQVTRNTHMQAVGQDAGPKRSSVPPGTSAAQVSELESKPDKPDAATSAGAPPNAGNTVEPDQPASNKCNIDACKEAYFTFNSADRTYQPLEGPRRLCAK
jgi:hypothetical protein